MIAMKTIKGIFVSRWGDGSIITSPAELVVETGEVTAETVAVDPKGELDREEFWPGGDEDEAKNVCPVCHEYVMRTRTFGGKSLAEHEECSNPGCMSHEPTE